MAISQPDHDAAREALREQAFAYVESLERESVELAERIEEQDGQIRKLKFQVDQLTIQLGLHNDAGAILRAALGTDENGELPFTGGLLEGLQKEVERSLTLEHGIKAALVNIEAMPSLNTNMAAVQRVLRKALTDGKR